MRTSRFELPIHYLKRDGDDRILDGSGSDTITGGNDTIDCGTPFDGECGINIILRGEQQITY